MARKIQVVDDSDRSTGEKLRKSQAALMVRRLLADWVVPNVSIRRRKIVAINLAALPSEVRIRPLYRRPAEYQHRLEPKFEPLTWQNSTWQRYLGGWGGWGSFAQRVSA